MPGKYRSLRMVLSSLGLAGLLMLGAGLSLALANFALKTRVTTASSADRSSISPSLSGDGLKVAFQSDSDFFGQGIPAGQSEIWLYDTTTMTLTRVTTASAVDRDSTGVSLSEDGSKLAFIGDSDFLGQGSIQDERFEVWLYDTAIMTFTRVTTTSPAGRQNQAVSLNEDGSKIAFQSDVPFLGQGISAGQFEIWLYNTSMMTFTRVTTASAAGRISQSPSINGDGSKITFNSNSDLLNQGGVGASFEIWLYNTTTMTFTRITTVSTAGRISQFPSISGDGSKIAFNSNADFLGQSIPANQFEIWLYDTTTMTLTRVTTASSAGRSSISPNLSADGSKVIFQSDSDFLSQGIPAGQFEIWLYDLTTMAFTRLTNGSASDRDSRSPSLSLDGSKVAFQSDSDFLSHGISDNQTEIWLVGPANGLAYFPFIRKRS